MKAYGFVIVIALAVFNFESAFAQFAAGVDARQSVQRARIRGGIRDGSLNRAEARRLSMQQRHIRRTERRMKLDGNLSTKDRARLHRKQNIASRNIRREGLD